MRVTNKKEITEMKKLCFECCENQEVKVESEKRTHRLFDIEITYEADIYICLECGKDVPDNELYTKNLRSAYAACKR